MEERSKSKAVHQSDSEPDVPSAANITPPLSTDGAPMLSGKKQSFLQIVQRSSEAVQKGDFHRAVQLYSEGLALDPANHILFSNRSAAYVKLGLYKKALQDARRAIELNSSWAKAYYREGVALQCLNKEAEALAAYAAGLAEDPKSTQLLNTFKEAATQSTLKEDLVPVLTQLQRMKLDQSPFLVVSVVGQVLLEAGSFKASVTVLESALRIGTCSQKLKGSVFSALSNAHWATGHIDRAIACMQQDLAVARALGDEEGECRAHSNLGAALFSKGAYREALQHHRSQLMLAMKHRQRSMAAQALNSLGHVYTALGDYTNALASHKQCVLLAKQGRDKLMEAKEIGNVGAVYLATRQLDQALECHSEHLKLAKQLGSRLEEARAYSNMGSAYHYKRDFDKAIAFHNQVLNIALDLNDRTLEARAYAGLGHASRCTQDFSKAKYYHEKQLDNALQTKDKMAEGRACSNLGIIYQHFQEYEAALKLHKVHLQIAKDLGDRASQGRAYGNIGNAHSAMGQYDLAIRFHKQELAISREVCDKHSECSTHGNLAVAYHALKMFDKAIHHYNTHLLMARDLRDTPSEARALSNIGNYFSSKKHFQQAIPYYEQFLILSQELQDIEGEGKACHKLGYVHYCLGNFKEAIRYYEQDLALAKDLQDKASMCRAYCNLGLAHKALGELSQALECQKYFLATAHMTQNLSAKFCALGNIGDVLVKLEEKEEALGMFTQQLQLARQAKDRAQEAVAHGNLGLVHKLLRQMDKALASHTQELNLCQELNDLRGECKAHGNLGSVHIALGKYVHAYRCYEEQLDRSRDLKDAGMEANAYGNLGITKVNMGHFDDAIGLFEQQLAMLAQVTGPNVVREQGRAQGNLGDCYEAIGDFEEAIKNYEMFLAVAQSLGCLRDQDRAYRGLGNAHRAMGNLQQALVCFEKRLLVAHEMDERSQESSAYGELGCLHSLLGNFEQAISCLQHQLRLAREGQDKVSEGEAACGLGGVYQQMGEYEKALEYHGIDLQLAQEMDSSACQCRAYGNLGLSYESLFEYEKAVEYQLQHLNIAIKMNDAAAMTLAYSSLGRIHHAMGQYSQAVQHLTQGLKIASDKNGSFQDEAKIRHRLGLALWGQGDLQEAQRQLLSAVELFESIRREAQFNNDYKLSLFDLQTASYQALQRVLVSLGRHDEALVIAERGRTRAFVDFLLERQTVTGEDTWHSSLDSTPASKEVILDVVDRQRSAVLYFSIAGGFLYSWLILPEKGIVRFHESSLSDPSEAGSDPDDTQSVRSIRSQTACSTSLLDSYVGQARESLGIESHISSSFKISKPSHAVSETESEADDLWQQHLEEIGDRLNAENDRTGFLRMVNRNHVWNASSLSLGSSSLGGGRAPSIRSNRSSISSASTPSQPPLCSLYELLIAPFEADLPSSDACPDLILVLQGDLYLVPFALLKSKQASPFLYERFNLLMVPSVRSLQASQAISKHNKYSPDCTGAVVIGNPMLPVSVQNIWQWHPISAAEEESRMVAEMMGCRSLTGPAATKDNVVQQIQRAELIHFATHVSWKLSALVLSPGESASSTSVHGNLERMDLDESNSDLSNASDGPPLSEFLLTAADVLNIKISAKLVVLSSGHTDERAGRINADGVVGLTRAFLAAGAQCVLFSLWPVPDMAARILLRAFYTGLLQGRKTSQALTEAMGAVRNTRQFAHPSNWASWALVGSEVKLSSKVALMGHALAELLRTPARSREAMRVVLHLVEKSLQRIHHGQRNAMYTTQQSIENKVGDVAGWRDLLTAMGFRFEPAINGLPASVFFPTSDPGDRLTQCSASLQALLGLAVPTLTALSKMIEHQEVGEALSQLLKEVSSRFMQENSMQMQVGVRLWRAPGCHEFLASLGFDLVEVGKEEVTIKAGKQANKRTLQFALQALVAVFDTQAAPRTLFLDSCSSMESLASSTGSASTTSNFSKTSSPPTSPTDGLLNFKRRSYFNPAEVDKLPSAKLPKEGSKQRGSQLALDPSVQLSHQSAIRQKYSSPSASDLSDSDHARVLSVDLGDGSSLDAGTHKLPCPRSRSQQVAASSSDSEGELSRQQQSRSSLASQGSSARGSALRRGRQRASVASSKSSASDRTLTDMSNSRESLTVEEVRQEEGSPGQKASDPSQNASSLVNPTEIAEKVLAETQEHRCALESMQKWSVQNLAEKRQQQQQVVEPKKPEAMEAEERGTEQLPSQAAPSSVKPVVMRQPPPVIMCSQAHPVGGKPLKTAAPPPVSEENIVTKPLAVAQAFNPAPPVGPKMATPILANSVRDNSCTFMLQPAIDSDLNLSIPLMESSLIIRPDDTYFSDSSISQLSKIPEEDEETCSQAEQGNGSQRSQQAKQQKSVKFNDEIELKRVSFAAHNRSDSISSNESSLRALTPVRPGVMGSPPYQNVPVLRPMNAQQLRISPPDYGQYRYKPPPPYPGLVGCRDSSSSLESILSSSHNSSPQSSALLHSKSAPNLQQMQSTPTFNLRPQRMFRPSSMGVSPVGYQNGLNSEGSSSEQEGCEMYSPKNMQRASLKFYQSGAKPPGLFKPYMTQPPMPNHMIRPRNGAMDPDPGHLKSPEAAKEWYLSDSDSVSSFQDTPPYLRPHLLGGGVNPLPGIQEGYAVDNLSQPASLGGSVVSHHEIFPSTIDHNSSSDVQTGYESTGSSSQSLPPQPSMEWHEMLYGTKSKQGKSGASGRTLPKELQQQLPRQQYRTQGMAHTSKC